MKKTILILLSGISLAACSVSEEIEPIYTPAIPNTSGILKASTLSEWSNLKINQPSALIKQRDKLIISQPDGNFNAYHINLQTREKQPMFARGRSKNEIVYPRSLCSSGNSGVTVLDIYQGMLFYAPAGTPTKYQASEELPIQLPAGQQHLAAAKAGNLVVATGLYEQGRYLLFSPRDNQAHYFLDYPEHPAFPNLPEYTKSILYASSVLKIRPDQQAFVCGDMYSGVLDICRIRSGKIERIKQHIFHYPKVHIRAKKDDRPDIAYSKDNSFGFTDISVSDDRIYAIYSGKTFRQDNQNFQHCKTLVILDWEGNILNSYTIDTPLTHISYDAEENAIYAIGYTPKAILVKINL